MNDAPLVFHVDRLELNYTPKVWAFALERHTEIEEFFASLQRDKPMIWNGRVLLLTRHATADGVFQGEFLETDYASFAAWIAWGRPEASAYDCFGAPAILSADGAFLLGRMGPHTANTGKIYFPAGTPEPGDIVDGKIDFDFSVRRELKEETGLEMAQFSAEPGWTTVIDGALIVHIKVLRSDQSAETLRSRILDHLAREPQPELSDILIARGPADFDPMMPGFVTGFLAQRFAGG